MFQSYLYTAQRGRLPKRVGFIGGCLKARNHAEAYSNAKFLVKERGGNVTQLLVDRIF